MGFSVDTSNVMISDDSMREMIRSLNSQQRQKYLMRYITGVKVNVNIKTL